MSVRRAADSDVDQILALEEQGFEGRELWSRASWASELAADNRIVLVAEEAEEISGVITVQQVGGVAELNRIIVASAGRRTGLGKTLLAAGIVAAEEAEEMLLEVRHDNAPAMALYAAFGFEEIARRNNYYGNGVDAVVMRVELEDDDADD
ncbi:ribosomal protein S18-alanine N-acetyltransferase [Ammonicoccus fulvus]|uniref:[Ribosomal protein bS18]-alanine N-acetyltransferase n=1 Tax=Ammonicoccus fulvus TaxID=3138240 RepID=A0ABZ3FRT4_9ACTN